ncbi:MAG: DUF2341 domain-containing protein, partial [Anaerolineales bacterium]|nr:DUF2341 domain-containing protein [Anaerolineales bacterium]
MQPLHVFQTRFLNVILILSLLLAGVLAVVLATPLSQAGLAAPAALPGYTQVGIEVRNNDASALPAGYTVSLSLDTAALVSHGQLQSDCDDLRISFTDASEVEIHRLVTGCNTVNTVVQFRTQAAIDPGATDARYALNYNNPDASNPPANPGSVFAFYDDFQDGNANGWTVSKGTWNVVPDGLNYVYRYTGGGANWPLSYASVPFSDLDYLSKIRAADSPKTDFIGLAFRIVNNTNFLTFYQARDVPRFKYARITNDSHSIISEPVFTMAADTWYWLRLQAVGSTLRARIWQDGASEPGAWNINTTDTTYQSSPNIGLTLYYHDTNADWDDIQVRRLAAVEPTVSLGTAPWWDNDWGYRQQVTITNTSASAALPVKYTASVTLDTEALINSGLMLNTCDDLRVAYDPGLAATEIDRIVENCNTSETKVWFALQRPVAASGQDKAYYVYYGNAVAGPPPADGMKVFLFFEDWEQGTAHWINAGGLDTGNSGLGTGVMGNSVISTDIIAVSSPHTQKYNTYGSGGDAISGYIPVTPSTDYAISVWGWATNTNVCGPVGFDWYNQVGGLGTETWVWTDEWRIGPQWAWHSEDFTTGGTTNFIKLKGEIWNNCSNPGAPPLYFDNMALRYAAASAPTLILGEEEAHAPVITIDNVVEVSDPVTLPNSIQISADIAAAAGTVTSATLRILSPQAVDVPMTLVSGDSTSGAWQASFTPNQGGNYTYRIYAAGSLGRNRLSEQFSFTAIDNTPPVITLVDITNPIPVRNTQTLVVKVTDIGVLSSVTLTTENATHAMSASGDQYSYDWKVHTLGTITYTVTASDTSGNTATLNGSFLVQRREADVCTWMGCRQGAASWSIDDGQTACLTELAAAGIHGTYYFNGNTTQSWFSTYSAAGHEIASHTVGHLCDQPSCFPNCTLDSLMALPVNQAYADSYRTSQIEPNLQAIEAGTGKPVLSLAWPCGCTDPTRMQAAAETVLGSRGYYDYVAQLAWVEDVNNPTPEYFQLLNTAHSYRQDFVDRAFAEGKWSITTSHGLCTGIDYLGQQNTQKKLWVAPVGEVLKYIKVRDASEISNYSRSDPTISFDAVHTLSDFQPITSTLPSLLPIVFDNPVTLQAHIQDDDEVLSVTLDGTPVTYTVQMINDMRYVTFDAALKNSRHVEITLAPPSPNISSVAGVPDPLELGGSIQFTANVVPAPGTTLGSVT